jgi:leucyl-tRNA synthetase
MNFREIDKKWQEHWEKEETFKVIEDPERKKYYSLIEFPYPSGEGLHVGHTRPYVAMDIIARKMRMEGYNVLFPIGWDAFGLPTENYAIKTGISPKQATKNNIINFIIPPPMVAVKKRALFCPYGVFSSHLLRRWLLTTCNKL